MKFMLIESCEDCNVRCYGGTHENPTSHCGITGDDIGIYWQRADKVFPPNCPLHDYPKCLNKIGEIEGKVVLELKEHLPVILCDSDGIEACYRTSGIIIKEKDANS